jgi:hypothetical protein
MEGRIF